MYNIWNIIIKKEMYIIQAMTGLIMASLDRLCFEGIIPKDTGSKVALPRSLQNGEPGFWHAKDSKSMVYVPM
jgi:hypothetical protein